ncbi:hypothetical protein [Streptomyces goshikiensis]|uniref:hypothetical protein n=1 Tax=Streptomyces goshikiensis TaxID=1942 RepID=UPI0036A0A7DB
MADAPVYRITFDRIGRHGGRSGAPAPAPIERALTGDALADSIALYARQFLGSPSFEVVVDLESRNGFIFAGFRTVGSFSIAEVPRG